MSNATPAAAPKAPVVRPRMALLAGGASIGVVTVLILIKLAACLHSGAASVLASLVDSGIDASVSLMTFMAIRMSMKPADEDHRYGHGKIEGVAALVQCAFIGGSAVFLVIEAARRLADPAPSVDPMPVIVVMGVSILLSLALVLVQDYALRHAPSLAVEADRAHYKGDIAVNGGVIAVMLALDHGAPAWIDPAFAVGVALYLGVTVRHIASKGLDMLLDRELPGAAREMITKKVLSHRYVLGMHDLRTMRSGMRVFISFDIEADPSLLLYTAHQISREVELDLLKDFPNAEIMIHVDPYGDPHDSRHHVAGVHH